MFVFENKDANIKDIVRQAIVNESPQEFLDIIPSTIHLALTAETANMKIFREKFIKKLLDQVQDVYDYVLIDC